jgi:hypothetical protein
VFQRQIGRALAVGLVGAAGMVMLGGAGFLAGKSLRKEAKDYHYGPPLSVADQPDGRRVFKWEMRQSMVVRRSASPYAAVNVFAAPGTPVAADPSVSPLTSDCIYTITARWDRAKADWLIVEARKPDITCV